MKELLKIFILFVFCHSLSTQAQNNSKYFEKKINFAFSQSAQNIVTTNNNYAISVGCFVSADGFHHARFMLLNDIVEEISFFDLNDAYYSLSDITTTPDDKYALVGFKSDCDTCFGPYHTYLHFIDENSNSISQHNIGANGYESGGGVICFSNIDNGYYVAGNYVPTFITPQREKLYLTKLNPSGEKLWEYTNWSYPYNCSFRAVLPANDGGCYAAGYIGYHVPLTGDFVLTKLNANGIENWTKTYDFDSGGDYAVGLIYTPDNCLMLCGQSGMYRAHLMKVKLNGDTIWHNQYFPNEDRSGFLQVASLPDTSYVAIGSIKSNDDPGMDLLITKVDSLGNLMWHRRYGQVGISDYGYDFTPVPTTQGGFVVVGRTDTLIPIDSLGVNLSAGRGYIVKTNCMGLLTVPQAQFTLSQDPDLPARFLFTNQSQYTYPDSIDGGYYHLGWGDGSPPYLCGQGYEPCSANAIPHTYQTEGIYGVTLQAIVCNDTSVAVQSVCLGVEPNPQAAFTYTDFGGIIQFTNLSQNSYLAQGGYFSWDFGDGSPPSSAEHPTHEYTENGSYIVSLTLIVCQDTSVYMQEVVVETVGLPPASIKGENIISVYPNPAQNTLTFTITDAIKSPLGDLGVFGGRQVSLYSLTGQVVLQTQIPAGEASQTISVAHLPAGVYFYMVSAGGGMVLALGKVAVVR